MVVVGDSVTFYNETEIKTAGVAVAIPGASGDMVGVIMGGERSTNGLGWLFSIMQSCPSTERRWYGACGCGWWCGCVIRVGLGRVQVGSSIKQQ